ncbi:MAG: hypothetical protein AAF249_09465 [Pseudomonadota bacterium]
MKLVIEIDKLDARPLLDLADEHDDNIMVVSAHGIDGAEWLTFAIEMTKILAPPTFALLTVLVTHKKKVIVVRDGKREPLSDSTLKQIEAEAEAADRN